MEFLILMKGLPGSGKSTLAAALARELRCPLIDKDDARDVFQSVLPQAPGVDWNALSYDVMFRLAERQLGLGLSVVADCPFARVSLYQRSLELVEKVEQLQCSPAAGGSPELEGTARTQYPSPAVGAGASLPAVVPATATAIEISNPTAATTAAVDPRAFEGPGLRQGPVKRRLAVVVLDVECSDEGLWRRRLEARGAQDAGTERSHKPGSWEELQAIVRRYGGSWRWSTDGSTHLPYHLAVDTAAGSTAECVSAVVRYLQGLRDEVSGGSTR